MADMTTVAEIERAIRSLPKEEIVQLSVWLERYESELWEDQIHSDLRKGRFTELKAEAIAEHEAGKTRPL